MPVAKEWFAAFSPFQKERRSLRLVRSLLSPDVLDLQDEEGMTAAMYAVMTDWIQALDVLVEAGANLELRHFRTGDTALCMAVLEKKPHLIEALLAAGANPDAANHHGATARGRAEHWGSAELFASIPSRPIEWPPPRLQNAEALAEHYHPRFEIPERAERESLQVGQGVNVYVAGPREPRIKVRITERSGEGANVTYRGRVETPIAETNLAPGTEQLTFGPEHVTTVWVAR